MFTYYILNTHRYVVFINNKHIKVLLLYLKIFRYDVKIIISNEM